MDMEYQRLVEEAKDLQRRLDDQMQQTIAIDRKLNYARKMLESERKSRRAVESEKAQLVRNHIADLGSSSQFLITDHFN